MNWKILAYASLPITEQIYKAELDISFSMDLTRPKITKPTTSYWHKAGYASNEKVTTTDYNRRTKDGTNNTSGVRSLSIYDKTNEEQIERKVLYSGNHNYLEIDIPAFEDSRMLQFQTIDFAGNTNRENYMYLVDTQAPNIEIKIEGNQYPSQNGWYRENVNLCANITEKETGIDYLNWTVHNQIDAGMIPTLGMMMINRARKSVV